MNRAGRRILKKLRREDGIPASNHSLYVDMARRRFITNRLDRIDFCIERGIPCGDKLKELYDFSEVGQWSIY
jgi:hypothetical protein